MDDDEKIEVVTEAETPVAKPQMSDAAKAKAAKKKKRKKIRRVILWIVVVLAIIADISVALYPTVSDYFNSRNQSRAVSRYRDEVMSKPPDTRQEMLEAARAYNKRLLGKGNRFKPTEEDIEEYMSLLDIGSGVMAVLEIKKIDVSLPVYHGTDSGVLQVGAGHMMGSSLPVGGKGTHSFLTGHRGLPSSRLLTDLSKLEIGDTFTVYVLGEILTYEIDDISTVLPYEVEALEIDPNEDYCTLLTCTPYGVNSHRLLVRGTRIDTPEEEVTANVEMYMESAVAPPKFTISINVIIMLIPVFVLIILLIATRGKKKKKKSKKAKTK